MTITTALGDDFDMIYGTNDISRDQRIYDTIVLHGALPTGSDLETYKGENKYRPIQA
jgi:hypothetical protein